MFIDDYQNPKEDSDIVLKVSGVSKKFCRNLKRSYIYGLKDIVGELLGLRYESNQLRHDEFWALQNISLEVRRGESVGLVGLNGSGKTTLLRIISGLMKPDRGYTSVRGRVATLIALGAGFNPLLSGRENLFINMSILGLSKQEILNVFDEVVDFAEIWDAINSPVRTYSSGMKARLGFACAVHTNPSLLLIDEALAVGDVQFRTKCYQKLAEIRESGTSFFMVSHSPNVILRTCDSAIYLKKGKVIADGPANLVMKKYDEDLKNPSENRGLNSPKLASRRGGEGVNIVNVFFRSYDDQIIEVPVSGEPLKLCIKCSSNLEDFQIGMNILIREYKENGDIILNLCTNQEEDRVFTQGPKFELQLCLPYCGLRVGTYNLKISLFSYPFFVHDIVESFIFEVKSKKQMIQCEFFQPHEWKVVGTGL